MNFNLLNQLTKEDRAKIENFIRLYGTLDNFIGIDEWLKYWSVNKIKMYKLLNNQLIYRAPFEYKKSEEELNIQVSNFVNNSHFPEILRKWLDKHEDVIDYDTNYYIRCCCQRHVLVINENNSTLKFKLEDEKKTLQFQKGTKPLRAISRFLTYCKNLEGVNEVIKAFEEFRLAHSRIFNDNIVKGNLVISIHPLDYMTMSDNNSNWQSCMSWIDGGCYHIGTVEMMNSNNVLCCYIENSEPYYFSKDNKTSEYEWNNKKWRQLVYFTKDIIVSGKAYPYANDDISKTLISTIRELARKNLHWTYSFGPELYQDMKYINTSYSMNRARDYISYKNMKKHNILFDTRGMYNDMLNDHYTRYWCVRNKVNHNKIISYSGKAPCLCCGEPVISYCPDYEEDYNERYSNCGSVICNDCLDKVKCDLCEQNEANIKHYQIWLENDSQITVCEHCVKDYFRKCPDCGRTMFVTALYGYYNLFRDEDVSYPENFIKLQSNINEDECNFSVYSMKRSRIEEEFKTIYPICRCGRCAEKDMSFERKHLTTGSGWTKRSKDVLISKEIERKAKWEKYFPYNLERVTIADGEVVTN